VRQIDEAPGFSSTSGVLVKLTETHS